MALQKSYQLEFFTEMQKKNYWKVVNRWDTLKEAVDESRDPNFQMKKKKRLAIITVEYETI